MKPIKLIISAFGPYKDEMPAIEFEQFEDRGIFLISGDTGAGKTMIFDAICYALYGETSGSYRDTKNLRCDSAEADKESFVDFYFSHQGKNYHIKRNPSYARINKKGNITTEKEKVIFYYPDGSTKEGNKEVDGSKTNPGIVKELLHVDAKEFMQIAMIAQGEFWSLLNATTDQRTGILRTIFHTESYKNIEFKLKDKMDAAYKLKSHTELSIVQHFNDITTDINDRDLLLKLEGLKEKANDSKSAWNTDELIKLIDDIVFTDSIQLGAVNRELEDLETKQKKLQGDIATANTNNEFIYRYNALTAKKKELEERKPEIEALREELFKQIAARRNVFASYNMLMEKKKAVNNTINQIESSKAEFAKAKGKLAIAKERLDEAEHKREAGEAMKRKYEKILEQKDKYELRSDLNDSLLKLRNVSDKLAIEEERLESEEKALANKINELKNKVEELKEAPEKLAKSEAVTEKLKEIKSEFEKILGKDIPKLEDLRLDLVSKQAEFEAARESFDKAEAELKAAERQLENSRAGILAKELKEGDACPVCGSTAHPKLAVLTDTDMTEEVYNSIKEKLDSKRTIKDGAYNQVTNANTKLVEFSDSLSERIVNVFVKAGVSEDEYDANDLDDLELELKHQNAVFTDKIISGENESRKLKENSEILAKSRNDLEFAQGVETNKLNVDKESLRLNKQSTDKTIAENKARLGGLTDLEYNSWMTAEKEMNNAKVMSDNIFNEIKLATEERDKANSIVTSTESAIATLNNNLAGLTSEESELKAEYDSKLKANGFDSTEQMMTYAISEEEIKLSESKLSDYDSAVKLNEEQLLVAAKDAEGKELIDDSELAKQLLSIDESVNSTRKKKNEIDNRINLNNDKKNLIEKVRPNFDKANKEYLTCQKLYDLVKGTSGNGKITLEQFIQADGFDRIIAAANNRLKPMSDGQYVLNRQESSLGKKSNTFLDLEVLDNYSGKKRPVGNLSGGESFKASLSLALGLSDTVSTSSGGVQMDALFVDEGFGTLDKKSIDSAMDVLLNLSSSNKLVGVISHREELIENIPQQIRIVKTKDGGSEFSIDLGI
ncbi:MAG: SMC family ATPase [Lachnospiraceae bacterium]|nr:SMC family ATPase [Lachnospiraceae bacterium]